MTPDKRRTRRIELARQLAHLTRERLKDYLVINTRMGDYRNRWSKAELLNAAAGTLLQHEEKTYQKAVLLAQETLALELLDAA